MNAARNLALPEKWIEALNLVPRLGLDIFVKDMPGIHYARSIQDALNLGLNAVHCISGAPSAAILHDPQHDREKVNLVHQALWNQGLADFLLVIRDDALTIHSLWAAPPEGEGRPDHRLLDSLSLLKNREIISDLLPKVESGSLFADYSQKLNHKTRVDARLISDLTAYRENLISTNGFSQEQAHSALLQAMFLRYLWDRGIISDTHTQHYGGHEYSTLHDLLRASRIGWRSLLSFLGKAFNGNMLLPDDEVWDKGRDTLSNFLEGSYDPTARRQRLIQLYQFNHIPVELISEVYDRFLEGGDEKKEHGAYYTPRRLAGLVVDQAWPALQASLDAGAAPRILDPTCGSGVFLVTIFQRMASHLGGKGAPYHWSKLKKIATNLHGTDTNPSAIHIAAFSLALALLNERKPREIKAELDSGNPILPRLRDNSLRTLNFFALPETEQFHAIIGNPPWGQQKGTDNSPGEAWCETQKFHRPPNREKAWPFLWKTPRHLTKEGSLTLLLPMTGCVQNKDADSSLRILANSLRLKYFVDLSDLRNTLFPGAKIPACILNAEVCETGMETPYRYEHYCPKADYHASKAGRILLAPEDRHMIWVQHFLADPGHVCKRLMWGGPVEERLLGYLESLPRLDRLLLTTEIVRHKFGDSRPEWGVGLGFQRHNGKSDKPTEIPELPMMPYLDSPDKLVPYVQPPLNTPPHPKEVRRRHFHESFKAPHIVMVPSTTGRAAYRLRATYSEQSFSFNMSLLGVVIPDTQVGRDTAKFLTVVLNSELAAWYLYYTTTVGSDRERFSQRYLFMGLPFPKPSDLPDPKQAHQARSAIVRIMNDWLGGASLGLHTLKTRLNDLVFTYYGIREDEVAIIRELFTQIRPAMHPGLRGFPNLWDITNAPERNVYCLILGKVLTQRMKGNTTVRAHVVTSTRELALVRIVRHSRGSIIDMNEPDTVATKELNAPELPADLRSKMLTELRHNVYLERAVFFFLGDDAYLLKPLQRRFWLARAAHRDADRFIDYLLAPDSEPDSHLQ